MTAHPVITVDGPSGVGKGTVCRIVAQYLGWRILDSGALYRLTGVAANKQGVALDDVAAVSKVARTLDVCFEPGETENVVLLAGEDVSQAIRSEEAGNNASKVAAIPEVREALLQRQRDFCQEPGLIADGRDMGTVVFPDAPVKVFLTASQQERAERRHKQLKEKGVDVNIAQLLRELAERDERDSTRSASPLKAADDAVTIDTDNLDIDQVVSKVMELWNSRKA